MLPGPHVYSLSDHFADPRMAFDTSSTLTSNAFMHSLLCSWAADSAEISDLQQSRIAVELRVESKSRRPLLVNTRAQVPNYFS
eukprot:5820267-Amphidinium_carterae.1